MSKPIKVVELFAGVGGFRVAAQRSGKDFDFI
jgi:site-specific DNA-cytosine methylase